MVAAVRVPALLAVADGRFPAGGHAHSFGVEAAVAELGLATSSDLAEFVHGRLHTVGFTEAALSAFVVSELRSGAAPDWVVLDAEVDARIPSPALRAASRQLGRQLARASHRVWDVDAPPPAPGQPGPHQCLVLGALGAALGWSSADTGLVGLHHLASAMTTAAVRLLGLDPYDAAAVLARAGPTLDELAARAAEHAARATTAGELPAVGNPLIDLLAESHAVAAMRLFTT